MGAKLVCYFPNCGQESVITWHSKPICQKHRDKVNLLKSAIGVPPI